MTPPPFDLLVQEHGALVRSVLVRAVGPVDADDCWQETFLAALAAYPRLRPDSNLRGWLLTIAHHKAVDALRARSRRAVPAGDDLPETPGPAAAADGDPGEVVPQAVDATDAADGLWRQVGALPDKQRLALAYRFGADLGYADVAALLGCSPDAARRSVFEGLRTIRRQRAADAPPTERRRP